MLKTVRFKHPYTGEPRLGLVEGETVTDLTSVIEEWTCPVTAWSTLHALGLDPKTYVTRLAQGSSVHYRYLELLQANKLLPPVNTKEVWAAGVTYERSRDARNAETQLSDSVYDRVYESERPELFFKSTYERLVPPGQPLGLRSDSKWMVPEPELAVVISKTGDVIGWTLGDDLSSRDIEGENPLYLPQAKIFAGSCSIGPCLLWNTGEEDPLSWSLSLTITRNHEAVFADQVNVRQLKRTIPELVSYLLRDNSIPMGTVLLTGTCIVPPDEFTLAPGDQIDIQTDAIGTLTSTIRT